MESLSSTDPHTYMAFSMTVIAFLACETTLPGTGARREDAFEHDLMIQALKPAFQAKGLELRVIDWEAPISAFDGVDFAQVGTTWNYWDRADAFLAKLDALRESGIIVGNSPDLIRWNIKKTYLRELADNGARTIPTLWREVVTGKGVAEALEVFECDKVVVKRQVGGGAEGQELLSKNTIPGGDWVFDQPAMIQPFLPAIASEGEMSLIFIDGEFSHALIKRAAQGDYRIQSLYGGTEEAISPEAKDIAAAKSVLEAVPFETPLYARIDMLRGDDGLLLMEAEMIEPYLYPQQGPQLGERLADAIVKRVKS